MGTFKVNGDLTLAAADEDRFLTFNYTGGTGYDWRIGYLGSGSGNENFLVIQSDKEGSTFYNALKFGLTTLNAEFGGTVTASSFIGSLSGNASTATKLATARTISLTGSVTGSGSFDGSGNLSISTTTNHTHSYLPLSGGTLTGNLTMDSTKTIVLRAAESWRAGIGYDTQGNECIALWAKNTSTSLRWYAGKDMSTMTANIMIGITPDFEISKASGAATGYIGGNTILHSGNYTSYRQSSVGDASMTIVPQYNNELNFGGSDASSTIYFGYRAVDSKPIPVKFIFGGSTGTGVIQAARFTGSAASADYAGSAGYLPSYTTYSSISSLDGFLSDGVLRWAKANSAALEFGNDGSVISVGWGDGYGSQVWLDDGSGPAKMAVRNRSGGSSWNGWRHCIMSCSATYYGSSLPSSGNVGDVFFKT